jgi:hypothetical protein
LGERADAALPSQEKQAGEKPWSILCSKNADQMFRQQGIDQFFGFHVKSLESRLI